MRYIFRRSKFWVEQGGVNLEREEPGESLECPDVVRRLKAASYPDPE